MYQEYDTNEEMKAQTKQYPMGKHLNKLSGNAVKLGTAMEAMFNVNADWSINRQFTVLKETVQYLITSTNTYLDDFKDDLQWQSFRYKCGLEMTNVKHLRKNGSLWILMPLCLQNYHPRSNKIVWLANTNHLQKQTKIMLKGIEKVKFNKQGYPQGAGPDKFVASFGFPPCVLINNDQILPLLWYIFNHILNKFEYGAIVDKCLFQKKYNQYRAFLQAMLNIFVTTHIAWQARKQPPSNESFKPSSQPH